MGDFHLGKDVLFTSSVCLRFSSLLEAALSPSLYAIFVVSSLASGTDTYF